MSRILWLSADRGVRADEPKGASAHLRNTVRAFRQLGHEVLVLSPWPADEADLGARVERIPQPEMLAQLLEAADAEVAARADSAHARRRVVRALGHAWNQVGVEQALERHVPRFRPEFVFERASRFGVAGVLACRRLGVPHVLNLHAPLAWESDAYRSQALSDGAHLLEEVALARASRVIVNSRVLAGMLEERGVDSSRISVVPNGVHLDVFAAEGPALRPAPEEDVVVAFSGSLKPWHGIDLLCEAFGRLAAEEPRAHLLVIGDGPGRRDVERLAEERPGRVTATGAIPLSEVPARLRGADLTVAPYPRLDPFYYSPLKVIEAMACGRATVASAQGQVNELLRHEETGLLVPPGDVEALVAALRRLIDDAALRRRLGAAARREAEQRHSWTDRAAEIVELGLSEARARRSA